MGMAPIAVRQDACIKSGLWIAAITILSGVTTRPLATQSEHGSSEAYLEARSASATGLERRER